MPLLYRRLIRVHVAGLVISRPRITFQLTRTADKTQDTSVIAIHNLNYDHEWQIYERGTTLTLEAGYPETIGILFEGVVQRVTHTRKDLARLTIIECGDQVHGLNKLGGDSEIGYYKQSNVRGLAREIIEDKLGLDVGPLDAIPEDAEFENYFWSGPAGGGLSALLNRYDLQWTEQDGMVRVHRAGEIQPDMSIKGLSQSNGLIGAPVITNEGAEVTMFLDPTVFVGGGLSLDAETLQGDFKVVAMVVKADNWTGPFRTLCALRGAVPKPPPPEPPLPPIVHPADIRFA